LAAVARDGVGFSVFYLQLVPSHAVYMANNQSISQSAVLFRAFMSVNTPHGGVFKASPMYKTYMVRRQQQHRMKRNKIYSSAASVRIARPVIDVVYAKPPASSRPYTHNISRMEILRAKTFVVHFCFGAASRERE
jgi:adenine-specific DNA methylase